MGGDEGKPTVVDRPTPASEPKKRTHDRYTQGDEIGRGGMGRVVEATDTLLDRRVAVKEALTTDPELLRRFARETKITARLEHPSIVPLYDAGVSDGAPYYVMRRVTGRPLSELIRNAPTLNERLALVPHLLAAAQAIAHAHQRGIIHRDIKPSNILVGELGETVVIDWGLAKVIGENDDDGEAPEPGAGMSLRTRMGAVFGTPGFMAPDQLRGEWVGTQGDVYSLGASLYNLLAAEPPHYASDSTQMMNLAAKGPPKPIAERVPGAPRELVTIVDTAIDYDTTRRYKDAEDFAEDLKRFLAGQLVASHRYSAGEKLVRFVRKYRAAVASAILAIAVVIVVGAIALSRVFAERDRADAQARLARQGRQAAEASREMADERADQLLLSRARALVDTNPTAALASLKQLSPSSKAVGDARGIAKAAHMRGVSWAMKAEPGTTATMALDQTAQRLAQVTADGMLYVYDLQARKLRFKEQFVRGTQIAWALGGERLIVATDNNTTLLDDSGATQGTLPGLTSVAADARGDNACGIDLQKRAMRIGVASQQVTMLEAGATQIAISPDGEHCTVATVREISLYDHTGKRVWRSPLPGEVSQLVMSNTEVAFNHDVNVWQTPLATGAFVRLIPAVIERYPPMWIAYHEDKLIAAYADPRILVNHRDNFLDEVAQVNFGSGPLQAFGKDYFLAGGDGRILHFLDGRRVREIHLPITLQRIRVAVQRDHRRVVALGDGAIVVVEMDMLPRVLFKEPHQATRFIGPKTILSSGSADYELTWFDLDSGARTRITTGGNMSFGAVDGNRVAILQLTAAGQRALIFDIGGTSPALTVDRPFDRFQLVSDDGYVFSQGNHVYGGRGLKHEQLFTTDGDVDILVRLGEKGGYAAVAGHELVRGNLITTAIERTPLPDGALVMYATGDGHDVLFSRGNRLYRWRRKIEQIAVLEADITLIDAGPHGAILRLDDGSITMIDANGDARRLSSTRGPFLSAPQHIIVPGQMTFDVVEPPAFTRWSLPIAPFTSFTDLQVDSSPDGTQLIEKTLDGRVWLWKLPDDNADLATMLSATNFVEDKNGILLWPWQSADLK
jgi:WD40 repeat protein